MEHFFELPVTYKGEKLLLNGRLTTFAYTYKFYIIEQGNELVFERDDHHVYSAILLETTKVQPIEHELVEKIIEALERLQPTF